MQVLPALRQALTTRAPRLEKAGRDGRAAVAAILHDDGAATRLLFIERARHDGDPWSGDLAFPGGRAEEGDTGVYDTAERETEEEIGWSLSGAERLGRLDDQAARILPLTISACVYAAGDLTEPVLSAEVVDLFWIDVAELVDPARRCLHVLQVDGAERRFPALDLLGPGRPLLWGVTYRFVSDLTRRLGRPLPLEVP